MHCVYMLVCVYVCLKRADFSTAIYNLCMGVQRHRLVFIMHISLAGRNCQILPLPEQYLAILGQGNMHNIRNKLPVAIFFIQGDAGNAHQIAE